MPRTITAATSLDNLKKEAKRWLKALGDRDPEARRRLDRAYGTAPAHPVLRDVQHALALEYGFDNWMALKAALQKPPAASEVEIWRTYSVEQYGRLADDWVRAYDAKDEAALQRLNEHYQRSFTFNDFVARIWDRVYAFRQRSSRMPVNYLHRDEARLIVAQDVGFGSWAALVDGLVNGTPRLPGFVVDADGDRIGPRRELSEQDWDELLTAMKERQIRRLSSNGLMNDAVLARVARLDHIAHLDLAGSRQLTDEGLVHLSCMPQLETLNLTGCKITDRGLKVLKELPNLREFALNWHTGISDDGVAHLRFCHRLEHVDLMGSTTGDGLIEALQDQPVLRHFKTGRLVTDAGLAWLRNFPLFRKAGGADPLADLLIDGPFTDRGIASLAGLEGIGALDLFWHVTAITSEAFAHLSHLPNLAVLGADGKLSDNQAMAHIGRLPRLRRLRVQETVATDEGFAALSRSETLESLWGRSCAGLGSRGFAALSKMPLLRGLGVSCKNVDDAALSTLPQFPALRELTPIDVQDDGFRHVGRCERLERLTCMYCRDTTDKATEYVAGLPITYYYAGLTKITDRSLEILSRMSSLEQVDLYECQHVTDAGLVHLAGLPTLRQVNLDGLPGVTLKGSRVFPPGVRVNYST
jgi:hypothetical protein